MENLKLILAVVLLALYGAKRVVQKLSSSTDPRPWYKESETIAFIIGEVILLAEEVGNLLGA